MTTGKVRVRVANHGEVRVSIAVIGFVADSDAQAR